MDAGDFTDKVFAPNVEVQQSAHVKSLDEYKTLYQKSIDEPVAFWGEILKDFHLEKQPRPNKSLEFNFNCDDGPIGVKWFQGATTNVCYNVLDRIVKEKGKGDKIAFYW